MPTDTLDLLINAGVASVFAVFALTLVREFVKFTALQNQAWREFLEAERKQRMEIMLASQGAMNKLSEQITQITAQTSALTMQTSAHTTQITSLTGVIETLRRAVERSRTKAA